MLADGFVEGQVVAGGGGEEHAHADAVGTVFLDEVDGVGAVAELFAHLAAQLVAHDTGEVDVVERYFIAELLASHNHAGNPEEDDVGGGDEVGGGVVVFDFLVVGVAYAVEERDGPEPAAEPGVEHVLVLAQGAGVAILLGGHFPGFFLVHGHDGLHLAVHVEIPCGDTVAPPELAADAPILDVLEPMAVGVLELGRMEVYGVVLHHFEGFLGEAFHLEEPLCAELGFDDGVGALAVAHLVGVVLGLLDKAGLLEVFHDGLAAGEAVHAGIFAAMFIEGAVVIEDVDALEAVLHAEVVIVDVVGRGDFQGTGAEFAVDIFVHDDGHHAAYTGDDDTLAFEPLVALVLRMHADGRVAHDGLGAGGGYNDILILAFDIVAQVEKLSVALLVDDLLVADGGEGLGVPIHHAYTTVDKTFVIEVVEDADDAFVADVVHGEGSAVPIAAGAKLAELLEDDAAILFLPFPRMFEEVFTGERALVDALLGEHFHHFGFGGDGGVVGAGHPAGVLALHAGATDEDVLDGVVEHVAHVEHAGHVGRRDDDGVWHAVVGLRVEELLVKPELIPFLLDGARVVFRC